MSVKRFLLSTAAVIFLSGCAVTQLNMPAVTEQPTNERFPGKIIWHDLLTDKPEASKRFYSELFGWEFQDIGIDLGFFRSTNYTLISHNGRLIGGMVDQNRLKSKADISQWVVLMSVEDIDVAAETVQASGGTLFSPPTDLANRGRIAVVADPQGGLLALLETKDGDPPDRLPEVNGFLWDELWTTDIEASTEFYTRIAPFSVEENVISESAQYRSLSTEGRPRVGLLPNPIEGLDTIWATYIRVEDPAAITARVEELGGSILLAPQERKVGGIVALIAGPSGAGIALQTWEPDGSRLAGN